MKYNKSEIMKKAWGIFKSAQNSFSDCLREAWKIVKASSIGNLWEKYGKCRVYFDQNSVLSICGVEIERYKTGNVCSCYVNGASVSNSDGRRWIDGTNGCYFDVQNNEVFVPRGRFSNEIVSSIRKFLNI